MRVEQIGGQHTPSWAKQWQRRGPMLVVDVDMHDGRLTIIEGGDDGN